MSSKFPAIPLTKQTEKNVKLFLDGLAGRMGIEGQAVTFQDLFNAGIIQLKEGITIDNIGAGTDPTDVITVPTDTLSDNPTTPTELSTTTSWGAIFLDWDYKAYNAEGGTEIWRSIVNDRDTANLIAVAKGRTYTDNVGAQAIEYFYWVRNRSISNTVSGYNQLSGTLGGSNLRTTVDDFLLADPDNEYKPFSILNIGSEAEPEYKLLLNADVLIKGDLAIGQLVTGELPTNVEFSIGNGSIVMSTGSNGLGSILVAGEGGTVENDYLRITNGSIVSQVWDANLGDHVDYKQLKRIDRGFTQNGVQTQIKAYFKSMPTVYLSFEDISVYNAAYPSQSQKLIMDPGPITKSSPFDGSWYFTPLVVLSLSAGSQVQPESYNVYQAGDTGSDTSIHSFPLCTGVTVNFTVGSVKRTVEGDWKNRQVVIYLDGSFNGGAQTQIGTTTVELTGDGEDALAVINVPVLASGTWIFQYRFVASDRAGTTEGTGIIYEYADDSSTSGYMLNLLTEPNDPVKQSSEGNEVLNYRPVRDASWDLFEVDYEFTFDWQLDAWCLQVSGGTFPETEIGQTNISVPSVSTPMELNGYCGLSDGDFANCSEYPYTNNTLQTVSDTGVTGGTNGKIAITPNDPLYLDGKFTASPIVVTGDNDPAQCTAGQYKGNGRGQLIVTGYNVKYYYRREIAPSLDVTNHFQVNAVTADLGATDISIGNAKVTYLAAGE